MVEKSTGVAAVSSIDTQRVSVFTFCAQFNEISLVRSKGRVTFVHQLADVFHDKCACRNEVFSYCSAADGTREDVEAELWFESIAAVLPSGAVVIVADRARPHIDASIARNATVAAPAWPVVMIVVALVNNREGSTDVEDVVVGESDISWPSLKDNTVVLRSHSWHARLAIHSGVGMNPLNCVECKLTKVLVHRHTPLL
jgi:hypothetical protein